MKRTLTLSGLVAAGVLSVAVSASQAPTPAAPQGPRVIDLLKLKDNFYVLTSAIPGDPNTFTGGNVSVLVTDAGCRWWTRSSPDGARRFWTRSSPSPTSR